MEVCSGKKLEYISYYVEEGQVVLRHNTTHKAIILPAMSPIMIFLFYYSFISL